jgi:hypothetical protein
MEFASIEAGSAVSYAAKRAVAFPPKEVKRKRGVFDLKATRAIGFLFP